VLALLGDQVHIAEPADSKSLRALQRWLGVRDEAAAEDIVQALLAVRRQWGESDSPLDTAVYNRVEQCWLRLNALREQNQIAPTVLEPLRDQKVIPNRRRVLASPVHRFLSGQPIEPVASTRPFLLH